MTGTIPNFRVLTTKPNAEGRALKDGLITETDVRVLRDRYLQT